MATSKLTAVVQTKGAKKSADDLKRFTKSANDAEMGTDDLGKGNKKLSLSFSKIAGPALTAVKVISGFAAGAAVAGSALAAFAITAGTARREIELLASQANTTADDFKAAAFATQQFGITAEQFGDISKDVADKVGEFASAGTGAFQDYADVLGLTREEAVKVAKEFQGLSSQEVIGRVVSELESVNATSGQTTFVLESLGNDLSRLAPLFAANSSELNTLKTRFNAVNGALALSSAQSAGLKQLTQDYDLFTSSLKSSASLIAATLAPAFSDFFVGVTDLVPKATKAVVDFLNSFKDAENISRIEDIDAQITGILNTLKDVEEVAGFGGLDLNSESAAESVLDLNIRLSELYAQRLKLIELDKVEASKKAEGIKVGGNFDFIDAEIEAEKQKEQQKEAVRLEGLAREKEIALQKIDQFARLNETELEAVNNREQQRKAILDSYRGVYIEDEKEYNILKNQIEQDASNQRIEIADKESEKRIAAAERERNARIGAAQNVLAALQAIGGKESKTAKRAAKASAIIDTYRAANAAYAALAGIPTVGPFLGAAAAGVAISAGLANVKAIDAAREQGGQFNANQNILVGERGPEIVNFGQSGSVSNNAANDSGKPSVSLVVIDQSEGKKEFEESSDDQGRIVLLIRNTVSSDIASPNSAISKSLQGNTNTRRAGR